MPGSSVSCCISALSSRSRRTHLGSRTLPSGHSTSTETVVHPLTHRCRLPPQLFTQCNSAQCTAHLASEGTSGSSAGGSTSTPSTAAALDDTEHLHFAFASAGVCKCLARLVQHCTRVCGLCRQAACHAGARLHVSAASSWQSAARPCTAMPFTDAYSQWLTGHTLERAHALISGKHFKSLAVAYVTIPWPWPCTAEVP